MNNKTRIKLTVTIVSLLLCGFAITSVSEVVKVSQATEVKGVNQAAFAIDKQLPSSLEALGYSHANSNGDVNPVSTKPIKSQSTIQVTSTSVQNEKQLLSEIPFNDVKAGSLFFKNNQGYYAQLSQNSDFNVEVNGLLARVHFSQTFTNESNDTLEAIYVFPLNKSAAVDSMVMQIGERRIVGEIKEKKQAKKIYQQAKKQGKKASLVSQQRPNMFTTKVANIAPHESITVSLSYLQSVNFSDDEFSLRLPLTITPRFIPQPTNLAEGIQFNNKGSGNEQAGIDNSPVIKLNQPHGWALNNKRVPDANEITPHQTRQSRGQQTTIAVNINSKLALANIKSSYHRINKSDFSIKNNIKSNLGNTRHASVEHSRRVTLKDNTVLLDRDFVLHWQLAEGEAPKAAFFTDQDSTHEYGLLMVMPPKGTLGEVIAKEVVYIIDTSGSMGGRAIEQAKTALSTAMDLLNEHDSFNIIEFNDQTSRLFAASRPVTKHYREQAKQWIRQLQAGGGTQMLPALQLALTNHSKKRETQLIGDQTKAMPHHKQIIFITDGAVGNEDELFTLIESQLKNSRLHTVGIGSAPNGYFMNQAAESGRGTYRYIGKINEVQEQMQYLFDEISRPMMTNIAIEWPNEQMEIFPNKIPDLYAGQPLVISAKWPKTSSSQSLKENQITLTGQLASTQWQQSIVLPVKVSKNKLSSNGVGTWWARQKIKYLNNLYRKSSGNLQEQLKQQITDLALHHSVLSKFTSFVAVEEKITRPAMQGIKSQGIANVMPHGSTQAIPLANTALGLLAYLYVGAIMLMIALFLALLSLPQWLVLQRRLKNKTSPSNALERVNKCKAHI